ncbi:MAG: NUDIX domain-containing protein [Planctomycetota bacterium]
MNRTRLSKFMCFEPANPPDILYHGTVEEKRMDIIRSGGLRPMKRRHFHLSETLEDAQAAARRRRGKTPMVLRIHSGEMASDGIQFLRSPNGVWLVDAVANRYLEFPEGRLREKTSAGGVLFKRENGSVLIALLHKRRAEGMTWELPKGGVAEGERLEETALREVREEAGVVPDPVLIAPLGQSFHTFQSKGMLVAKTTHYFLFEVSGRATFRPQQEEGFVAVRWFPLDEAVRTVSYGNLRPILRSCREHI